MQIVVVGNAFDGMRAFGPFFTQEASSDFTDTCGASDWLVVDLAAPYRAALVGLPGAEGDEPVGLFTASLPEIETPDGPPEFLVTLWPAGDMEIATRLNPQHSWGPPVPMEQKETR